MTKIQIFDPPMCCSSGVCGTNVDTRLVKFAGDLEWLKKEGIEVERYGLSFEPAAFVNNAVVKKALETEGNECLPLIVVENEIVYRSGYPDRTKLAEICGIDLKNEDTSQEAVPVAEVCGADCDCHQTDVGNKSKKIIFVAVIVIIVVILVFKSFCKADAADLKITKAQNAIHLIKNKTASPKILGQYIDSISQINFTALKHDAAFIFIPAKNNANINAKTTKAALKAQKALNAKNIKVGLYTLKTASSDYASISSQNTPPGILVVYKDGSRKAVSCEINETSILQAYVAASMAGGCGSECPCH